MRPSTKIIVAQTISFLGYPYLLVPASIALIHSGNFRNGGLENLLPLIGMLAIAFGLVALITWLGVRSGRFSNFDVSVRNERTYFYRLLLGTMLALTGVLFVSQPDHPALRGLTTSTLLLASCFLLNQKN